MKTVATLIALLLAFTCLANPLLRTNRKRAPLQGKVKVIRRCSYGWVNENELLTKHFYKDYYNVDSFSEDGRKLCSYQMVKGVLEWKSVYKYGINGQLLEEVYNDKDGGRESTLYTYDESGNLIKEAFPLRESSIIYTYKSKQLATKDDGGNLYTYAYNDKGQIIEELVVNHNDSTKTYIRYKYDFKNRIILETWISSRYSVHTTYEYDEHNNEILSEEHIDDEPISRRFRSEYMYDSHGNWLRCMEDGYDDLEEGAPPKELTIREIEYY